MFIAIEGIDACGKSTQTRLLAERLNAKLMRFPDDETPIGKLIRAHLNREWTLAMAPLECPTADGPEVNVGRLVTNVHEANALVFQALHFANRLEKAREIARMLLRQDVVADRYLASAIVYGSADGLDVDYLIQTQQWLPQPDLNILIDIPPELSAERKPESRDRYESQPGLMEEVMSRYRKLWAKMREVDDLSWVIIDGSQPVYDVHTAIVAEAESYANEEE
jgi:dTMP kinase